MCWPRGSTPGLQPICATVTYYDYDVCAMNSRVSCDNVCEWDITTHHCSVRRSGTCQSARWHFITICSSLQSGRQLFLSDVTARWAGRLITCNHPGDVCSTSTVIDWVIDWLINWLIHVDDTSLAVTVGELGLQDYVALPEIHCCPLNNHFTTYTKYVYQFLLGRGVTSGGWKIVCADGMNELGAKGQRLRRAGRLTPGRHAPLGWQCVGEGHS